MHKRGNFQKRPYEVAPIQESSKEQSTVNIHNYIQANKITSEEFKAVSVVSGGGQVDDGEKKDLMGKPVLSARRDNYTHLNHHNS